MRRARPGSPGSIAVGRRDRDRKRGAARWVALAIAGGALAGCFSDRGLAVEIDVGDTGATSVELYIGKVGCSDSNDAQLDCGAITPKDATGALRGDVWFRDDLLPNTAEVKGRIATFQLRSDDPATMPVLIAVGMVPADRGRLAVGSATLRDVAIPVSSARIATATLVAAKPVQPPPIDPKNLTEDRVQVWNKQTPPSSCVVVEHWQGGVVTRDFVVPIEDPDCDDVMPECNPTAYHGASVPGSAARPDCFASGGSETCVLGSHGCTDDGGPDSGNCAPQHEQVCVPRVFCDCQELDPICIRAMIDAPTSTIPHFHCQVPARMVATGLAPCSDLNTGAIDLSALVRDIKCEQPVLVSLPLDRVGTSQDFGGAIIELLSPSPACNVPIAWKSGTRIAPDQIDHHALIKVPFADSGLLVPLVLDFTLGTCTAPADEFKCAFSGDVDDPLWSCAR